MVSSLSRKLLVVAVCVLSYVGLSSQSNVTISCVGNFNLSLNDCSAVITPSMISAGTIASDLDYTVTLKDKHGAALSNATITDAHIGKEITYTLTHNVSENSCWGVLLVEDKIAPIIDCDFLSTNPIPTMCYSYLELEFDASLIPLVDHCGPDPEFTIISEDILSNNCDGNSIKLIELTIQATDVAGNISLPCTFQVSLTKIDLTPDPLDPQSPLEFPKDTILICNSFNDYLDFNGNPSPSIGGVPYIVFKPLVDTILLYPQDDIAICKLNVVYNDEVLVRDGCFTKIARTWTIIEGCLNNPEDTSYTQQIAIMDLEAPVMEHVPEKLSFLTNTASQDFCAAITPVPIPDLSDNCQATEDLSLFVVVNRKSPQILYTGQALEFQDGQNELIYIATDGCFNGTLGSINETRDTVDVWVEDKAPPVCEIDNKAITLNNDTGEVKVFANTFDDGSYDDCSNKVKVFAKRQDDGTVCPCSPEDALDRYSGFSYLGRFEDHDYYLSEDTVIGPKAINISVAMGGNIANFEKAEEQIWVNEQVELLRSNANPAIDVINYTVADPDGTYQEGQGWDGGSDNDFYMASTESDTLSDYDGLAVYKQFLIEVDTCGYSETIRFCCTDNANGGAPVTFRTMDKWGNFNECDLSVVIQDKVAPIIMCPPTDTLLCIDYEDDIDLTQFGAPTSIDACPAVVTELDADFDIGPCKTGTIIRHFEIMSSTGSQMCDQLINVIDTFPRDSVIIQFPPDIYLPQDADLLDLSDVDFTCFEDTSVLNPAGLPDEFSPIFENNRFCSDLWVGYTDDIFEVPNSGPNTCFKLVRNWIIVDDCNPMQPDTIREYSQSIIITNDIDPTIEFLTPEDDVCNIASADGNCLSENLRLRFRIRDECTAREDIDALFYLDLDCDGTFDSTGVVSTTRATAILNFSALPIGSHKIIIEAIDACNNTGTAIYEFNVINCVAPIAACQALTMPLHCFPEAPTSPLNNGGTVGLTTVDCDADGAVDDDVYVYMCSQAEWFAPIKGDSYHPCDLPVVYSFSLDTTDVERCFSCEDICGPTEVTIYVTDIAGNVDSCITTMTLTDPKGLCPMRETCFITPTDTTTVFDVSDCEVNSNYGIQNLITVLGIEIPTIRDEAYCSDVTLRSTRETTTDADGCEVEVYTWNGVSDVDCGELFTYSLTFRKLNMEEIPMTINCPDDVTVDAGLGTCRARVTLPETTFDGCHTFDNPPAGSSPLTNSFNDMGGIIENELFLVGTTTITYTVVNDCGYLNTCLTNVTVVDITDPVCSIINDIGPIEVGFNGINFTEQEVINQIFNGNTGNTASDQCGDISLSATPAMLDCTDLGANGMGAFDIVFVVEDEAGNSAPACTATINLIEEGTPTIECPDTQTQVLNAQCRARMADYTPDVIVNNTCTSGIALGDITQSPAPTTLITSPGPQTVTITATTDAGDVLTCTFVVQFLDETPPAVTCPTGLQNAILNASCDPIVPDLRVAVDNCDGTLNPRNLNANNANNPGVYQVPRQGTVWNGTSELIIVAVDAAGNRDTCDVRLRAVDNTNPVCNTPNPVGPVSVGLNGIMFTDQDILDQVFAVNGNNVSDNCMDITFAAQPQNFGCIDLDANGEGVRMVTFTVTDGNNNSTTCVATINLEEAGMPEISCPDDKVRNLNLNCRSTLPDYTSEVMILNTCTSGITLSDITQSPAPFTLLEGLQTQTVTMTATASNGQVFTCMFDVELVDVLNPVVDCPSGVQSAELDAQCRPIIPDLREATDNCDGELMPRNLNANNVNRPGVYQVPRQNTIWDGTSNILIVAVDSQGNRDTCMVVLSAACPGPENAPVFSQTPADQSTDSNNDCEANIGVSFQVDYCIPANLSFTTSVTGDNASAADLDVTITNVFNMTTTAIVEGTMPAGSHTVTLMANDTDCNLSTPITFDVVVIASGGTDPTYQCKKIVKSIRDGAVPSVTFAWDEIVCVEGGLACDGSNPTLIASFSDDPTDQTRTYTCSDIGDIQVTMFIWDVVANGNNGLDTVFREPCFAIQTVLDQGGFCNFFRAEESDVEGRIRTEDEKGVENTSVALIGDVSTQEYMTEEHGLYAFPSMPLGGSYTIKPHKEDSAVNGLSTLDLILIQKHILGVSVFDSPYKIIAADINQSGSLSAVDLLELRKVILAIQDDFSTAPAWKMIDAHHQFLDPENPLSEPLPNEYIINELNKNMAIDFVGIKMGDVNLSADPGFVSKAEIRTSPEVLDLVIEPIIDGEFVQYDFTSTNFNEIEGFQFTLEYQSAGLVFDHANASVLDMKEENIGQPNTNALTISYDKIGGVSASEDELLFSLIFRHSGELKHTLKTNSSVLAAQAYSTSNVFDLDSEVRFGESDIRLYQNNPNPWLESTQIDFMLPVAMDYEMRFFNVSGTLIHSISKTGDGGLNTIELRRDQLDTKGLIYYELITATEKTTRRMILIR